MNSILHNSAIAIYATFFWVSAASAQEFGLPLDCASVGVECRIQQYVDMDTGPAGRDPFCSTATYDGHDGTDIRVLSMIDVAKGVPVIAMVDGKVLRGRDSEPDKLVTSQADRAAVVNKECGNGVLVEHGVFEVQYCHMRQGSLLVKPGDKVEKGQKLGEVGASGMAQFPHIHITVRQNSSVIDPMTGATPNSQPSCIIGGSDTKSLWSVSANQSMQTMASPLLQAGISGVVPTHNQLSSQGAPALASISDAAIIGWVWFANLQKGDQIKLTLRAPDGSVFSKNTTEPLDRNKADYSAYIGQKQAPSAGQWALEIALVRSGKPVFEAISKAVVK